MRGISWFSLREYDNAIKDFGEAIKLARLAFGI
ncbi:MAG TPA: tetratricopeptide repeat protein [Pirellulales bacterium]|nr:tetratricopeptide repeat protein [Pirellulales bacterium]